MAIKAERVLGVVRVLGATICGVRGFALRSMYLVHVRMVMEYRYEVLTQW